MTTSTTGFVVFNKSDKTFLCYEQKLRWCSSEVLSKTPGDIHLGGGYVASTNFRPKHILASKGAAQNWAKWASKKGTYEVIAVNISLSF